VIEAYDKRSRREEYEAVAKAVLDDGGPKTKSVKEISETSRVIKEKMDQELKLILDCFELKAEFFIQN